MMRLLGLKGLVLITLLTLGIALVGGYTFISARSYVSGMDNIMAGQLGRAAMQSVAYELGVPGPREEYMVTRTWEQQPAAIREAFGESPSDLGTLYRAHVGDNDGFGRLYFAVKQATPAGERFVTQQLISPPRMAGILSPAQGRLVNLALIGLGSALVVGLVVLLLWRRISTPIAALGDWAARLNERNLNDPVPDFVYPELNRFAELMRTSLDTAQQGLQREQAFLSHTSHELRTPISVVRNNVELLRKIQTAANHVPDPREIEVVNRIDRASLTMKNVTETLLWLGRDDRATHPSSNMRLDQLITDLVEGLRYLLSDSVALSIDLAPAEQHLPESPTRIVLGNLIRNAFQHTREGTVEIFQRGGFVRIINTPREAGESAADTGFGLGLKLTERFTERLGWRYLNEPAGSGRRVEVTLIEAQMSTEPIDDAVNRSLTEHQR